MAIPKVQGYPDYTYGGPGNPGTAAIPVLFSGKLLEKFYAKSTIANISSTDYVGELKKVGDRVVIRTLPNVTIKDYQAGMTLELEYPNSPAIEFVVSKAKYFNFALDDSTLTQSDISWVDKLADDAAQWFKIVIDTQVFSTIYTKAHPKNSGVNAGIKSGIYNLGTTGNPVIVNKINFIEYIIDCETCLDEQDVPDEDRWIVIPPSMINLLSKSDLKDASLTGDSSNTILRGGFTGKRIGRFNIYESNLLYKTTEGAFYIPFGRKNSLVFVAQLDKTEKYRPQNTFAEAMKGLMIYDFDVINNKAFGVLYAKIG